MSLMDQIFGEMGYSTGYSLNHEELKAIRLFVSDHWLQGIEKNNPELLSEAREVGIENYHLIANRLNHKEVWSKSSRVLTQAVVEKIKTFPFIAKLKNELGEFSISDVYDTYQHHGEQEIYWRLVRPNIASDVGPLHVDKWFHESFNMGKGMFPVGVRTVKIWIPLFCESGKNGLAIVPGSHLHKWNFHIEEIEGLPKPIPDDDLSKLNAQLMNTESGNMLIFNENTLHGGVVNKGNKTRVSAEITLVLNNNF
jgi:hypothetical protein